MKKIILLCVVIAFLIVPFLANALSCVPRLPVVGLVDTIQKNGDAATITLDKVALFMPGTGASSIDFYLDLVKKYIQGGHRLPKEKPTPTLRGNNVVTLHIAALEGVMVEKGDIIANGPPGSNCGFSFTGFFSKKGHLHSASISGGEYTYAYGDNTFGAKLGNKISCDKTNKNYCTKEAVFTLGSETFTLKPGESYVPKSGKITNVRLIDAFEYKGSPLGDRISYGVSFLTK